MCRKDTIDKAVLDALRSSGGTLALMELVDALRKSTSAKESETRTAVWRLFDRRKVDFTDDLHIEVAHEPTSPIQAAAG